MTVILCNLKCFKSENCSEGAISEQEARGTQGSQEEHDSADLSHPRRGGQMSVPPGPPRGQRIIRCQSAARLSAGLTQGLRGRVCLDWAGLCWRSAWPGRGLPIQVSIQSEVGITRLDQSEASIRIKPPSGLAMAGGGQWPLCPAAPGTEPRQAAAPCPAGAAARRDCQVILASHWSILLIPSSHWSGGQGGGHHHQPPHPHHQEHLTIGHFDSNDSNPSLMDPEEGRRSPSFRPRSRSLR